MASFLILGAIYLLRFVDETGAQLGLIAMFTILFAASVAGLTSARRTEIFAATAAYAAVLVVFVSTTQTADQNCICTSQS